MPLKYCDFNLGASIHYHLSPLIIIEGNHPAPMKGPLKDEGRPVFLRNIWVLPKK